MAEESKKTTFEYESRRRKEAKEQRLVQWFYVAGFTVITLTMVSVLGIVTTGSLINPLKAKQLALMIANPPLDNEAEDEAGAISKESADATDWFVAPFLMGTAKAAEGEEKKEAAPAEAAPSAVKANAGVAAGSGDPMSSQTIIGDILEVIMMVCLYLLFAMAMSGTYILWTVRRGNFFMHEDHLEHMESKLAEVFRLPIKERLSKWRQLKTEDEELRAIMSLDNHLSEVGKQLGSAALTSETTLDRYFIAQTKDIREEEAQKLHLVSTALNVAPAVGFAGTVQGMIVAFSLLGGDVSPEMINMMSQGIFVALVTTFMALIIKSVGLALKSTIVQKINFYTTQLQLISSEVSGSLSAAEAEAAG